MAKIIFSALIALLMISVTVIFCTITSGANAEGTIDMTTLTIKSSKVGYGTLCINKGLDGGKIDMQNENGGTTVYEKGFTAHASSELVFDISNIGACLFTSYIGAEHSTNNATPSSTSVKFIVKADGKTVYESGVMGFYDPAIFIEVALPAGTKTLSLITDDVGSNTGDHSAWGEPKLSTDASALEKFSKCTLEAEKDVYIVGEQFDLSYGFTNLGGKELIPDTLSFSSSDPAVATVDNSGHVVSKGEGDTVITITGGKNGETFSKTIIIAVLSERVIKDFALSSPNQDITLNIQLTEEGKLCYTIKDKEGNTVAENCFVGIETDKCNFSYALKYNTHSSAREVRESYQVISGKRSVVEDHYNEMVISFKRAGTYYFDVYFRAYDEGFAHRFNIRRIDGETEKLAVIGETGTYTVSGNSKVYAEFLNSISSNFCYEQYYETKKIENLKTNVYAVYPVLFDLNSSGRFLFLSESDLYGDSYAGSATTYIGNNTFKMCWAPKNGNVTITTDFTSPWRFGIYGNLETIVESDMTEKLATPSTGDFSWVEPGITAWTWLSEGYAGQSEEAIIKEYVDMAAEMGWKYMILDEGWNTSGRNPYCNYYKWFPNMVKYAAEKGVYFIAWVYSPNIKNMDLSFLDSYAEIGIKGIKIDFFDSEDQYTIDLYRAIYEKCAELHLMVNCHGANKPTGERKTYPNVIAREGVIGEEYGSLIMATALYWPYTRNVVGPIDITPRLYPTGSNSVVSQMAVNIIFECGFPCMASDANDYLGFSANSFYKNLPATWDDIHFIDGTVGSYASIARRSQDVWYAASMTTSAKKSAKMPLDFLDEGTYYALIYSENGKNDVSVRLEKVTNKDTLTYSMRDGGGYIVKLINEKDCGKYLPTNIVVPENLSVIAGNAVKINYQLEGENIQMSDVVFRSENPNIVAVDGQGTIIAVKPGKTVITVSSYVDSSISSSIEVTVCKSPYVLNDSFKSGSLAPILDMEKTNRITVSTANATNYSSPFSNELMYTVSGDFTASVKMEKMTVPTGFTGGVILRCGNSYIAIERSNIDGAKWYLRSSDSGEASFIMTDYNNAMIILFEKVGDSVTVSCGSSVKNATKRGSITVKENDQVTVGLYALMTPGKDTATFSYTDFTVNDTKIPFSVPNPEKDQPTVSINPTIDYPEWISKISNPIYLANPAFIVSMTDDLISVTTE